jgi:hypothetical protein
MASFGNAFRIRRSTVNQWHLVNVRKGDKLAAVKSCFGFAGDLLLLLFSLAASKGCLSLAAVREKREEKRPEGRAD